MRVEIRRRGNSASVRIPSSLMAAASLRVDQTVEITEKAGRIMIAPVAHDIDRLIEAMDPATFPEDADFGRPRGREIW